MLNTKSPTKKKNVIRNFQKISHVILGITTLSKVVVVKENLKLKKKYHPDDNIMGILLVSMEKVQTCAFRACNC